MIPQTHSIKFKFKNWEIIFCVKKIKKIKELYCSIWTLSKSWINIMNNEMKKSLSCKFKTITCMLNI
jgi:hypothetical protein